MARRAQALQRQPPPPPEGAATSGRLLLRLWQVSFVVLHGALLLGAWWAAKYLQVHRGARLLVQLLVRLLRRLRPKRLYRLLKRLMRLMVRVSGLGHLLPGPR